MYNAILPSAPGSLQSSSPSRKGVGPMRYGTLAIIGSAVGAVAGQALKAPFLSLGANPYLDLIASHDPGLHAALRVWYYAWPAVVGAVPSVRAIAAELRRRGCKRAVSAGTRTWRGCREA